MGWFYEVSIRLGVLFTIIIQLASSGGGNISYLHMGPETLKEQLQLHLCQSVSVTVEKYLN